MNVPDVLNPALYMALRRCFGEVKVTNRGMPFKYTLQRNPKTKNIEVKQTKDGGGEQYNVCCPICGDERNRLVIGHAYLTKPDPRCPMVTHNLFCYNEECNVYGVNFFKPILEAIGNHSDRDALFIKPAPPKPVTHIRMPAGCIPLDQLPPDHPAIVFLAKKYNGLPPEYLAQNYGATFTSTRDDFYKLAHDRIIFPVTENGVLVGWQGRSIYPGESQRWVLSAGFKKVFYNGDRVDASGVPKIAEGITSSICCGPHGIALFGKEVSDSRAKEFASRWRTGVVCLDPETFVEDVRIGGRNRIFAKELEQALNKYCKDPVYMLQWPQSFIDAAKAKLAHARLCEDAKKKGEPVPARIDIKVPDPADVGIRGMAELLQQVPAAYRSLI